MTEKSYAPDKFKQVKNVAVHPNTKASSTKVEGNQEEKVEEQKLNQEIEKVQEKIEEQVKEEKKETKKEIKKKEIAEVNAHDMPVSLKHSIAICDLIRNKKPAIGIWKLEMALKKKFAIPMKGEIPHRHGNIMAGRYCFKASEAFIKLLKSLEANASVNGMNTDNLVISEARASQASQPYRRFGKGKMKRTHIYLKVKEKGK